MGRIWSEFTNFMNPVVAAFSVSKILRPAVFYFECLFFCVLVIVYIIKYINLKILNIKISKYSWWPFRFPCNPPPHPILMRCLLCDSTGNITYNTVSFLGRPQMYCFTYSGQRRVKFSRNGLRLPHRTETIARTSPVTDP